MLRLGIDIGGTKINAGLYTEQACLLAGRKLPLPADKRGAAVLHAAAEAAEDLCRQAGVSLREVTSCGIGVPGSVTEDGKTVLYAPNLAWEDEPAAAWFQRYTGLPATLMQDARAAALAEYLFGAGQGSRMLLCLTLGTGIGCGIVCGGACAARGVWDCRGIWSYAHTTGGKTVCLRQEGLCRVLLLRHRACPFCAGASPTATFGGDRGGAVCACRLGGCRRAAHPGRRRFAAEPGAGFGGWSVGRRPATVQRRHVCAADVVPGTTVAAGC